LPFFFSLDTGTVLVTQHDLAAFSFGGSPVRLMAPQQGIWKPAQLGAALSLRTVYAADPSQAPYEDAFGPDNFLRYKWRGFDPQQSNNQALRNAMTSRLPLIWFRGMAPALYLPVYPVWLAAEEPEAQQFVVAFDAESLRLRQEPAWVSSGPSHVPYRRFPLTPKARRRPASPLFVLR